MKQKTKYWIIFSVITIFVVTLSVFMLFLWRGISRIIAWEDVHYVNNSYVNYFYSHPEATLKFSEIPTEVSDVSIGIVCNNSDPAPYCDRWGTAIRVFVIKKGEHFYCKAVSAGPDKKFETKDDVINSEYDDSGTVYSGQNLLKNKKSQDLSS